MILGLPVISMKCSGPEEILKNGIFGELCDNYESLANAIDKAYSDTDYLKELQMKSLAGGKCFNIRQSMQQIEMLLDRI